MEKYFSLEQLFFKHNEFRLGSSSQFRPIYEQLLPKLRLAPFVFNESQYWQKLSRAEQVIDDIASALKAFWVDAPPDKIWSPVNPQLATLKRPNIWSEVSPVDTVLLHDAANQYLQEPWMQMNTIDWYILNGFIYDALLNTSALIKTDKASAPLGNEHIISGVKYLGLAFDKVGRRRAVFVLKWVLIPALIFCLYYFGYEFPAALILLPYTIYVGYCLLSLPEVLSKTKKSKPDSSNLTQKQNRLSQLYHYVSASTFNPSRLKEQIVENEKNGIQFDPVIHLILENAIQRDAAVFKI